MQRATRWMTMGLFGAATVGAPCGCNAEGTDERLSPNGGQGNSAADSVGGRGDVPVNSVGGQGK